MFQKSMFFALLPLFALVLVRDVSGTRCVRNDEQAQSAQVSDEVSKECSETEYSSYVECIRRRAKRHIDCSDDCDGGDCQEACGQCDCNYCSYNDCDDTCSSCCSSYEAPCATRTCCQATCHSSCRTSHCRRSCRSRCNKAVERVVSTGGGGSGGGSSATSAKNDNKVDVKNSAKHNITTVINLHNVVNNTNIVDMPVMLNNTNLNNITLQAAEPGTINVAVDQKPGSTIIQQQPPQQQSPPMQPVQQQCCNLISPRQCVPTQTEPYSHCFHTKSKVCGSVCQSSIMHAEPHRVCEGAAQTQCHQQVAYIPQPQPRCFSTSAWPYVSCSVAKPDCGGCYTHLVQGGAQPSTCANACYEGGPNVGPSYGPAPYYPQPMQQYYPPMMGGMYPGMSGGMGEMGPMGMPNIQSIGATFEDGSQNVKLTPSNGAAGSHDNAFMKNKRHSAEKEKDASEEFTVEEFPIKMN